MRISASGNVGIGNTNPQEILHVSGNIRADGVVFWGNGLVRTETRINAGLSGANGACSGFFESDDLTTTNYPNSVGTTVVAGGNWWHLLDVRHSNNANNYAMQFAGCFYDQKLYRRKTNNNEATPWNRVATSADAMHSYLGI